MTIRRSFRPLLVALAIFTIVSASLSIARAAGGPRIVNGLDSQTQPTVGALLGVFGSTLSQICSGTMTGCETFVTAAHCVCPGNTIAGCSANPASFKVFLQHGGVLDVASIDVDPTYNFAQTSDIAVVTIVPPAGGTGIPPTPINETQNPGSGRAGVIAGYGITEGGQRDSGILREGQVVTAPCFGSPPAPEPAHVCWTFQKPVGDAGLDSNTCSGDSGGPLFVNFGLGDVLAGITSGGENGRCTPLDSSFDTNVFQNSAFVRGVAGADLDATSCGTVSQVGDVATTTFEIAPREFDKATRACRKEISKQTAAYLKASLRALSRCINGVYAGEGSGACPDSQTTERLDRAAAKVEEESFAKKCPGSVLAAAALSEGCAGATNAADLVTCVRSDTEAAAGAVLESAYTNPYLSSGIGDEALEDCQRVVAKVAVRHAVTVHKSLVKCEGDADRGKITSCPSVKIADKIATAAIKAEAEILERCDDSTVATLNGFGGDFFGGTCAGANSAGALSSCRNADDFSAADTLRAIQLSADRLLDSAIEVPPGTTLLRVALNALDPNTVPFNELDLYVRQGAPASTSLFDASSTRLGVFESVEVSSPSAGTWYLHVEDVNSLAPPFQLTATAFQ